MTIEEAILEKVRKLPPEKQHEVLDSAESLQARAVTGLPRKPLRGALEGPRNFDQRRGHRRGAA
jgi:hypothetical protein